MQCDDHIFSFHPIEKKNPLKQGLKPKTIDGGTHAYPIEKKNPLKQGLKLFMR